MRNPFTHTNKFSSGFTLIELLIVIGILGILAALLLATIDPFQQLKKGQDTQARETAASYLDANTRYFGTHNGYPWTVGSAACQTAGVPNKKQLVTYTACITDVVNDGELKGGFTAASTALSQVYATANGNSLTVCYLPNSKAFQNDPNTKYNQDGSTSPTCTAPNCYYCLY